MISSERASTALTKNQMDSMREEFNKREKIWEEERRKHNTIVIKRLLSPEVK